MPRPLFDTSVTFPQSTKIEVEANSLSEVGKIKFNDADANQVKPIKHEKQVGVFVPPPAPASEVKTPGKIKFSDHQSATIAKKVEPAPLFSTGNKTVQDLTAEDLLEHKHFSAREVVKIKDYAEKIDLTDRLAAIQYGQDVNKKLAQAVDSILNFVKNNAFDSNVSPAVSRLHCLINFNPNDQSKDGLLGLFKKKKTLEDRINETISSVDSVLDSVEKNVSYFLVLLPQLDDMLDQCKELHTELLILVAAGKERLDQFRRRKLKQIEEQLQSSNMMIAQNARDALSVVDSFTKRVETLELTIGQNELTLAQIRLTQDTNVRMIESLNNIMSNMIPMWKHSLIAAITTKNFDAVNTNKDVLSKNICDIMNVTMMNAST